MPPAAGDPGVFVCGPGDIAPWETAPVPARARPPAVPARRGPPSGWLIPRVCLSCDPGHRDDGPAEPVYCDEHCATNWWLENFRPKGR
jgi:hypothetical protein